ncbi:MAG: hypothetical protein ACOC8H_00760 [bacterium]
MTLPEPDITVNVDVTNPGQFFACCGLLELADRLSPGAEGWFESESFVIAPACSMGDLLKSICEADLEQLEPDNETASPMRLGGGFDMVLDWWNDELTHGKALKVWAGSMRSVRIAHAMKQAMADAPDDRGLLDYAAIVYDPDNPRKKVEPYYFDSRRGWNAQARDLGFSPDSLKMTTIAYPGVEFLCLVGLQRFRPAPTERSRVFAYCTWHFPLPLAIAPAAASGTMPNASRSTYRFENGFRTDQRKHKSFLPATPIGDSS